MNLSFDERLGSRPAVGQALARVRAALRRQQVPGRFRRDLTQDILLAVLDGWHKRGAEVVDPERWFNGIIRNHVQAFRRRRFMEMSRSAEETRAGEQEVVASTQSPEESLVAEERRRILYQFYGELPDHHRDVVIARWIDGLPFEDIATAFARPYSTVYGYYQAGMRGLRAAYERWKAKQPDGGALLLPITLEALLETDRTAPPLPAPEEEVERAWRRVQQELPAAEPADSSPSSGPRPSHPPRTLHLTFTLPLIGYLLVGQPYHDAWRTAAAPLDSAPACVVQAQIPAAPAATDEATSASSEPGSGAPDAVTLAPRRSASADEEPGALSQGSTGRANGTALRSEQGMLEQARSALITGNAQGAMMALEKYTQTYPDGLYARERDRTWLEALVLLGRTTEACEHAESIRRAYPSSPLPPTVDTLCR